MLRRSIGSSKSNAAGAAALVRRSPPLLLPLLAALLLLRRRREAARLACGRRGMLNSLRHSGSAAVRRRHALNDGSITTGGTSRPTASASGTCWAVGAWLGSDSCSATGASAAMMRLAAPRGSRIIYKNSNGILARALDTCMA